MVGDAGALVQCPPGTAFHELALELDGVALAPFPQWHVGGHATWHRLCRDYAGTRGDYVAVSGHLRHA
eukprot:7257039-Lingulodinium_polyedra.AAC.1